MEPSTARRIWNIFWPILPGLLILGAIVGGCAAFFYRERQCQEKYVHHGLRIIGGIDLDNESCKIEEIILITNDLTSTRGSCERHEVYDNAQWCVNTMWTCPMVRRINCPSGIKGASTVSVDDTKFHHEVLR